MASDTSSRATTACVILGALILSLERQVSDVKDEEMCCEVVRWRSCFCLNAMNGLHCGIKSYRRVLAEGNLTLVNEHGDRVGGN